MKKNFWKKGTFPCRVCGKYKPIKELIVEKEKGQICEECKKMEAGFLDVQTNCPLEKFKNKNPAWDDWMGREE